MNADYIDSKIKGVNLGGWLVLEKWITPSVFSGTQALDEINLHEMQSSESITSHYKNFITEEDFEYLSELGINAVRIPVGYWVFGDDKNFPSTIDYLDFAFSMCEMYGLKVLIDLHGAPGSQNGWDHSGSLGEINWDKHPENISATIDVLSAIAKRYCTSTSLWGVELLNEPHPSIPLHTLKEFYIQGYHTIRRYCSEKIAVVFNDSFRPLSWNDFMTTPDFKNVIQDSHLYQCFNDSYKNVSAQDSFKKIRLEWENIIGQVQETRPMICGEWSLAIDEGSLTGFTEKRKEEMYAEFAQLQLEIFSKSYGWFYWTYKTEAPDNWNFREMVHRGFLPQSFY